MATYKVIQDIEAEDKLLGPLTLRQFIYGAISAVCLYVSFLLLTKHAGYFVILFLPVALISGFFAFPFKANQPTEIWALAKIRFMFKPRKRIWDQSGAKELVTITAPKQVDTNYTNGLSQTEVKSRLRALADTIDTRGWAIKNVNVNLDNQMTNSALTSPDRLIDISSFSTEVPNTDVQASDDILDPQSNLVAQHLDQMINASSISHKQQIRDKLLRATGNSPSPAIQPAMTSTQKPNDYWFLGQPQQPSGGKSSGYVTFNSQVIAPGNDVDDTILPPVTSPDEELLAEQIKAQRAKPDVAYEHMHTLQPYSPQQSPITQQLLSTQLQPPAQPPAPMTQTPDPGILNLASNNDLNIATIARQANGSQHKDPPDEVIISLH